MWDAEENPPKVQQFDAFGKRVDHLQTSYGWKLMKSISAREG